MSLSNLANPKSILAKLLAQENLSIEHRKIQTAGFDPVNRVLYLPIWKDMTTDLYDLLVGHEVGHAWETPAKGWHNAIEEKGKAFKSFLNVVEDARIEKCIKNRYPGLKAPFYRAYKELHDKDFFGVHSRNLELEELTLIDRLNLHFKVGPFLNVPFLPEEQIFVHRMDKTSNFDEVYELACELYQYHKDHETRIEFDDVEDYEDYELSDEYEEGEEGDDIDGKDHRLGSKGSRSNGNEKEPSSLTDKSFREKEKDLLADNVKPYVYCNLPVVDPKNFIVHHTDLYTKVNFSYIDNYVGYITNQTGNKLTQEQIDYANSVFNTSRLYSQYKNKNIKFIQYLIKEFELKRNASQYARASVSKSGELDTEKVWAYKLKDDLFKRVTKIPKGKNHGMVMFIDWSGSMNENLENTIEQFLILADFCRKVGIPFEVYAFSDCTNSMKRFFRHEARYDRTTLKVKDLAIDMNSFSLLNLLSSSMTSNQYRNAQYRLLQIAEAYKKVTNDEFKYTYASRMKVSAIPNEFGLSGTPLDEAIVTASYIVPFFKAANKLDVVNTIFLTDGDGAESNSMISDKMTRNYFKYMSGGTTYNLVIKDTQTGIMATAKPGEPATVALLKLLKARSQTNLVGYFISHRNIRYTIINMAQKYGQFIGLEEAMKFHRQNKYYGMADTGYDNYFLVQGKDLEIQESNLDTGDDSSKNALKKAFISNQKNKFLNRILISRFVDHIAA